VVSSMFGASVVVFVIPGLGVLTGFFSGVSMVTGVFGGKGTSDPWLFVAILGQLALALLAGVGATRKYQRQDVPAFSWPLALVLLSFVALYGCLGVRLWPD